MLSSLVKPTILNCAVWERGSNVILMPRVSGLICRVTQADVCILSSDEDTVTIAVGAGKNWHELVQETLAQNWFGLENLR